MPFLLQQVLAHRLQCRGENLFKALDVLDQPIHDLRPSLPIGSIEGVAVGNPAGFSVLEPKPGHRRGEALLDFNLSVMQQIESLPGFVKAVELFLYNQQWRVAQFYEFFVFRNSRNLTASCSGV